MIVGEDNVPQDLRTKEKMERSRPCRPRPRSSSARLGLLVAVRSASVYPGILILARVRLCAAHRPRHLSATPVMLSLRCAFSIPAHASLRSGDIRSAASPIKAARVRPLFLRAPSRLLVPASCNEPVRFPGNCSTTNRRFRCNVSDGSPRSRKASLSRETTCSSGQKSLHQDSILLI